jgi:UDP-N-acetyl-D-mannosaminuronic acid transferase (WecB/TagA/CpsF family)
MSEHPHIIIIAIGNHVDLETGETTAAPTIAATVDR